jgi:hypothetical protein
MKIRSGFVSNSSSTAFILDCRDDSAKKLLSQMNSRSLDVLSRNTGVEWGKSAVTLANAHAEDVYSDDIPYFTEWILEWAEKLGEDNIVLVRESDEGLGGYLFNEENDYYDYDKYETSLRGQLDKIALSTYEYH